MIKAVFFDLDDTLYDQLQSFELAVQAAGLRQHSEFEGGLEHLYTSLRRHSDLLWSQYVGGEMTLDELRTERTIAAFAEQGITLPEEKARLLQACYELEQGRLQLRPESIPLIQKLKDSGFIVGLITNGPVAHQMGKIEALGLHETIPLERIHISDGLGFAKPDIRVFQHVQKQEGLQPDELIYIGDAWHNDIAPSFHAGWQPIWLNVRQQKPAVDTDIVQYIECGTMAEAASAVLAACKL